MISKKFYINIFVRIVLILLTCLSLIPFLIREERLFTILSAIALIIIQVFLLLKYINRFNNEVANFFSALKTNDASYAFHDKAFKHINEKLRNDIEHIRNQLFSVREQKQIQQSYLKTLIENSKTGIISITNDGTIDVINRSAISILNIKGNSTIKALENKHPKFVQFILNEDPKEKDKTFTINSQTKPIPLSIRISEFKQKQNNFRLVTFQNIESELNEKELMSWQKLIRVLTHEITNSISPISSLADSLENLLIGDGKLVTKDDISDITIKKTFDGLQLISERGESLVNFINNYKTIASLKKMNFEPVKIAELYYNLELLMKSELEEKNIKLEINVLPIDLEVKADKKYIEQLFINLIKNSVEAIENESGSIKLSAYKEGKNEILKIQDNGKGIENEIIDQVFIPFYSTKEHGSGIGLSLAHQVMLLHGGNISVKSEPGKQTIFTLKF